jgi:hypothetical protein
MTSPVVHEGRLYAASFDGWAYCLDAAEGALLWKWRGAPMDRVIPVFGKLVSAWPVVAVQFHEGVLYGVAGHWSVNGAVVFALDAVTGQPRWTHWSDPNQSAVDSETGSSPVAAGSGYLAILDDRLFVPNFASPVPFVFDCATGKPIPPSAGMKQLVETRSNRLGHRTSAPGIDMIPMEGNRLLGGGVPLLNPPNMRKNHTARFMLYSMDGDGGIAVSPFPETLIPNSFPAPAHDGNEMLVAGGVGRMTSRSAYPTLGASLWRKRDLLDPESRPADSRGKGRSEAVIEPNGGRRLKRPPDALDLAQAAAAELDFSKAIWSRTDIDLNAVALGPNAACLVMGQQAGGVSHDEHGGYEAWKLIALSREDGSVIWSVELPLEPVFNGIAAADGKIVLSLRDGTLLAVNCGEEGR